MKTFDLMSILYVSLKQLCLSVLRISGSFYAFNVKIFSKNVKLRYSLRGWAYNNI